MFEVHTIWDVNSIVIFGSGRQVRPIVDIIRAQRKFRILGLIDRLGKASDLGLEVIGSDDDLPRLKKDVFGGIVAVGDNPLREQIATRALSLVPGFRFISAVHPKAHISSDVTIGPGSAIMAGAIIGPGSSIGAHCIINTNASIDHDGVMEDFSSLAPGAVTGGNVHIGARAAVCLNASVIHRIKIGQDAVIGAGSVVVRDVPPRVVVFGSPARIQRKRKPSEPYL